MSKTFFIADTHFNHERIISICKRPFSDVEEMEEFLIDKWNSVVNNYDTVWLLGDFFYFGREVFDAPVKEEQVKMHVKFLEITSRLKGIVNLIIGNHDTQSIDYYKKAGFNFVSPYPIILNNFYILSHEPLQLSETTPYYNVYGHVHNDSKYKDNETSKCVSVERIDYKPIQLF